MAYSSYTPAYYSSLHESITSVCKNILPFSFKKRRLPAVAAAEQMVVKQQSDNLKWQQESFHQMQNLMVLCKEGILHEDEVSVFRAHILETLVASSVDPPAIQRDKLIFLQDLLNAKCISEDEYHASKRPLLHRLAAQGAELGERDVIKKIPNEGWSSIDLKYEKCLINSERLIPKNKSKQGSASKKMKGASSCVLGFVSPDKYRKLREDKNESHSINKTMRTKEENTSNELDRRFVEKESESKSVLTAKRKPFRALFQREQNEGHNHYDQALDSKEKGKLVKKAWGFDGFKKWKKNNAEDETAPLSVGERSDDANYAGWIVAKKARKKSHFDDSPANLFVDEDFAENVKKEVSRIQTELSARSERFSLSCDRDVVREEFKERGISGGADTEKHSSKRWTTFDEDDENSHPNRFGREDQSNSLKQVRLSSSRNARASVSSSIGKGFKYNPFFDM